MESIIEEFEERACEVELYFTFVTQTSVVNTCISNLYPSADSLPIKIDTDLKKILKANLFILLYNLIESSFKKTLLLLIKEINNSQSTYGTLIPEIRKIWLKDKTKFFSVDAPKVEGQTGNKLEHYYSIINNMVEHVLSIPDKPEISGNLDGRKIKEISAQYGALSTSIDNYSAQKLVTVKRNRNELAHGDISFLSCGRDWETSELEKIKNQVIQFMRLVLNDFNEQISQKYYQKAAS